jgi:hypothetical protein
MLSRLLQRYHQETDVHMGIVIRYENYRTEKLSRAVGSEP